MSVTIYDISRALNVSAMTVSRVLNQRNAASVAPTTRERIERAAREMGYRPNRNARALATGRTNTVAVWISHLRSSVYGQIADACRKAIHAGGMEASVVEMNWHFPSPGTHPRVDPLVDGILAIDPPEESEMEKLLGDGAWQSIPRVHIGSGNPVRWGGDYVHVNMSEGARVAVEHLVRIGCRRIAYSVPTYLAKPGSGHYDSYLRALQEADLPPELILHEHWTCPDVRQRVRDYVREHGHPDGLFCHHDEMAIAAFRALRDLQLRIPEDVALIGCEGNEFLEYFDPPLSTVTMPIAQLCETGWQLLQQRMQDPEAPVQQITLPFEFAPRESAERRLTDAV